VTGCISTGRGLSAFIRERIAAKEYNSFLGLVASFQRQDFLSTRFNRTSSK